MKKVLVGCGVMLGLFLLVSAGGIYWFTNVAKEVAGEFMAAAELAGRMPTDRLEQEAADVTAPALLENLREHSGKPVRVTGTVMDPAEGAPKGSVLPPQPAGQAPALLFLEPAVLITLGPGTALPSANLKGKQVEVLGIASRLTLGNAPGVTEAYRKDLQQRLGGTDMPVVIARRVELIKDAAPADGAPAAAP